MKNAVRLAALAALAASGIAVAACSDSATATDAGTSPSSTTTATGTTTSTATGTGTGTTPPTVPGPDLNGCKNYVDRTADGASREIAWGFNVSTTPEACMRIKVGQTVTWKGELGIHPIGVKGGDANNPIKSANTNTVPAACPFGYVCTAHSTMTGVVVVVP